MKIVIQILMIAVVFTAIYTYCSKQPIVFPNEPQWIDLSAPRSEAVLQPDSNREFTIRIRPTGMTTAPIGMPIPDDHLVMIIDYNGKRIEVDKAVTTVNSVVDNTLTFTVWNGQYSNYYKGVGSLSVKVKTNSRDFEDSSVFIHYKD